MNKLFTILTRYKAMPTTSFRQIYRRFASYSGILQGAIALSLLFNGRVFSLPTEYVFTAPPEVDLEVEEIPTQEEYPLYECDRELEDDEVFDSHNCACIDCEDLAEESEEDKESIESDRQVEE